MILSNVGVVCMHVDTDSQNSFNYNNYTMS